VHLKPLLFFVIHTPDPQKKLASFGNFIVCGACPPLYRHPNDEPTRRARLQAEPKARRAESVPPAQTSPYFKERPSDTNSLTRTSPAQISDADLLSGPKCLVPRCQSERARGFLLSARFPSLSVHPARHYDAAGKRGSPMDISFNCDKCGKNLVIDNAGAGITIDCPECGKAVYVPSTAATPKPKDPPARVEPKPLTRVAAPTPPPAPAPAVRPRNNPLVPSYTSNQKPAEHPSIAASVHCLVILVGIELVGFFVIRQNMFLVWSVLIPCEIFAAAAFLCAVYGMCVGHVRHGLLVLAGLALIVSLSGWIEPSAIMGSLDAGTQQQMQNFQKAFPLPTPHP
jgi:DNA-directed RNA polymerase subunit RPC12/RpoP